MSGLLDRFRSEPAVAIGLIAGAVLAAIQYLGGHAVISGNVVDSITRALDPTSGWAIPIVLGIVTRFFVSPASKPGV